MKISDFNISGQPIPEDVVDKIYEYHFIPLSKISAKLNAKPSVKSSYRPRWWELKMGRSGNSQHCYYGKGATDVTCDDFKENKYSLLDELIGKTEYTRFAMYDTFIHCDYAHSIDDRWVFDNNWKRLYKIQ